MKNIVCNICDAEYHRLYKRCDVCNSRYSLESFNNKDRILQQRKEQNQLNKERISKMKKERNSKNKSEINMQKKQIR